MNNYDLNIDNGGNNINEHILDNADNNNNTKLKLKMINIQVNFIAILQILIFILQI